MAEVLDEEPKEYVVYYRQLGSDTEREMPWLEEYYGRPNAYNLSVWATKYSDTMRKCNRSPVLEARLRCDSDGYDIAVYNRL